MKKIGVEPLKSDEIREAAPAAVAALIHSGAHARSLFDVVRRLAAMLSEPTPALIELGTLLDAWEAHLPAGHRAGDASFWYDVSEVCWDVHHELIVLELDSLQLGNGEVLLGAIAAAARAHLKKSRLAMGKRSKAT